MAYGEIRCHICGVGFNVSRIRRPDEPSSAAWHGFLQRSLGYVESPKDRNEFCPKESGCMVVPRVQLPSHDFAAILNRMEGFQDGMDDIKGDGDYVMQDCDCTEPYEYDSPVASDTENDSILGDYEQEPDDENTCNPDAPSEALYSQFLHMLENRDEDLKMIPQHNKVKDPYYPGRPRRVLGTFEHIAGGLDCQLNSIWPERAGYNGHAISAEDMRGCNSLQCFIRKSPDWQAEPDDQEFEKEGHFFLSGLSEVVPSRNDRYTSLFPERHGVSSANPENIMWLPDPEEDYVMPFHPACLEVFKRASLHRNGHVDIEGLIDWWGIEAIYDKFHRFPRHPAIKFEESWIHEDGNEFLAANPCFSSQLTMILEAANWSDRTTMDVDAPSHDVATRRRSRRLMIKSTDIFDCLPWELRLQVLYELEAVEVAHLRLASRTFRHLPQSFFHAHTLLHMPWLWEAWSTLEYSIWSTTTAEELKTKAEHKETRLRDLRGAIDDLADEGKQAGELPNLNAAAIAVVKDMILAIEAETASTMVPASYLSGNTIDWYGLRCELARNHSQLLGLRNRERIWKDCGEILDRIDRYRREGKIVAGQPVDPRTTAQAECDRRIRHNRAWHAYCAAGRPGDFTEDAWA